MIDNEIELDREGILKAIWKTLGQGLRRHAGVPRGARITSATLKDSGEVHGDDPIYFIDSCEYKLKGKTYKMITVDGRLTHVK